MKLIIDIPEAVYRASLIIDVKYEDVIQIPLEVLANGTPLDDVKAEIEKLNPVDYGSMFSYESHNGARDMKRDILDIIDNIGNAESQKLADDIGFLNQSLEDAIDCS